MNRNDVIREVLLSDTLKFTCYFFKQLQKKQFVVGKHHRTICNALNRVVRGECKRLIINISPRYGKCVAPDTQVMTTQGIKDAKDIVYGDMLYCYDNGKVAIEKCLGTEGAFKPSVKITMRSGRELVCSYDHPMLTPFGYQEVQYLSTGDNIVALNGYKGTSFYTDTIESITSVGPQTLIHLEVNRTHNFIANGLVSHNTELAVKSFIAYGLALNPQSKFLHLSYSSDLAQENSVAVKDIVESPEYQEIFDIQVKQGSNTKSRWDTEQGGKVYATSTLGQITGFGAGSVEDDGKFSGAIIIDDPIKPEDALSDNEREKVNRRFETTIRNRVNSRNTPIIIIMQRLHEHDLCGYLQEIEPEEWEVVSMPCITDEGKALWEFKHTLEELQRLQQTNSFVFETQYMQNPKPIEGLMYGEFQEYDTIPLYARAVKKNYTDTADTGSDYFCSICYEEHSDAMYVTDIIYTKKSMEYTEQAMAQMLAKQRTQYSIIESNNGGRIFRRNVEKITREYGNLRCSFKDFTQTKNKQVRIFSYSNEVTNLIRFPRGWERKWAEFAGHIKSFRKEGVNQHDDAEDVLTGMVEFFRKNAQGDTSVLNGLL